MGLETATYIKDLVPTNPVTSDFVSQGDDHIRLLKSVLQSTFPSLCGPGLATVGGTANAITLTYSTAPGSNLPGEIIYFTPTAANTGPVTISVNGNAALGVYSQNAALVGGELQPGVTYQAMIGASGVFNLIADAATTQQLVINGPVATSRPLFFQTATVNRWAIYANNAAESGSNVGSDLVINRYNDAGAVIDTPLEIARSSGIVTIATAAGPTSLVINGPAGTGRNIFGQSAASDRWQIRLGNPTAEVGSNTGSDFDIVRFSDASVSIDSPLSINRASGSATFSHTITVLGISCRAGTGGGVGANSFNIFWSSPNAQFWVDNVNIGNLSYTSDYRTKRDIAPLPSMWERIKALRPISYKHKDYTPKGATEPLIVGDDKEHWGFVAHEMQETLIEDAAHGSKDEENVIQSPNPWTVIATLTKALQEAIARIEALETQIAGVQHA